MIQAAKLALLQKIARNALLAMIIHILQVHLELVLVLVLKELILIRRRIIRNNLNAIIVMKDVHFYFYFQFFIVFFFLGRQCSIKSDNSTDDQNNNEEKELTCSACYSGYFLYENACITSCPDGFYGDSSSNACIACSASCKTCSGGGGADCITCPDNTILSASGSGQTGMCKDVSSMEDEYSSDEKIESKLQSITSTSSIYQATTEFT